MPTAMNPGEASNEGVSNEVPTQHAVPLLKIQHTGASENENLNGTENTQNATSNKFNLEQSLENGQGATATQQNTTTTATSTKAEIVDAASLKNIVLRRHIPPESVNNELSIVHSMWEMAAVFDFFNLFRQELKLTRSFGVEELEHVLITSPGDGGLLADVHVDLMRGISPKNEVTVANWQVHLANKIKFHWRNLSDGTPCPFKPDKYLEALEYAELPTPYRVKALHFLCCIRADREDILARIAEAEREKFPEEIAVAETALEAARQKSSRGTRAALSLSKEESYLLNRAAANKGPLETVDDFRREPTGTDSNGKCFYYFPQIDGSDANPAKFRLYQDIPADMLDDETKDKLQLAAQNEASAALERELREAKMSKKRRERALKKMPLVKADLELCDPPAAGAWSLAASNLEELIAVGEGLAAGRTFKVENDPPTEPKAQEDGMDASIALGRLLLDQIVPQITDSLEAEQRRQRAAERVRSKLGGVSGMTGPMKDSFGTLFPAEGAVGVAGRSRRERRAVNYAFPDYDDVLKSAIRGKKRSGSPDEVQGSRRSVRGGGSYRTMVDGIGIDAGLRRGRSEGRSAEQGLPSMGYIDERALRMAARSRHVEKEQQGPESLDQQEQREEHIKAEEQQAERYEDVGEGGEDGEVEEVGDGRRRKKRRPAGDFVYYDDDDDIEDEGGRRSRAGAARRATKAQISRQVLINASNAETNVMTSSQPATASSARPGITRNLIEQQQRMDADLIKAMTGKPEAAQPSSYAVSDHYAPPPTSSSLVRSGVNLQPSIAFPDHQRYAAALHALLQQQQYQQQQYQQQQQQYQQQQYQPYPQFQQPYQQQYQNHIYSRPDPLASIFYPPRPPPLPNQHSGRPTFFQGLTSSHPHDGSNAGNVTSGIDGSTFTIPQRREG
jgi:hypothetical protein